MKKVTSLVLGVVFFISMILSGCFSESVAQQSLMRATKQGDVRAVKKLLAKGADVGEKDQDGATALMWAAYHGYPEITKILIKAGADVNAKDQDGITALMGAAEQGHAEIVNLLKRFGARN
jgi:ankyrin repeat protein